MVQPAAAESVTFCAEVYVPAAGVKVGAETFEAEAGSHSIVILSKYIAPLLERKPIYS